MERKETICDLPREVDSLIRLHHHGLNNTKGYQERRRRMQEYVRINHIDVRNELDTFSLMLYQRYIE